MKDLTTADLRAFVRDVISGKSVRPRLRGSERRAVTGGKGTATRTMAFLGTVLTYAVAEGYRPDNPARGIVLPSYEKRKVRLDPAQYAALGRALAAAEARASPGRRSKRCASWPSRARGRAKLRISSARNATSATRSWPSLTRRPARACGRLARPLAEVLKARVLGSVRRTLMFFLPVRSAGGRLQGPPRALERMRGASLRSPLLTPHGLRHSFRKRRATTSALASRRLPCFSAMPAAAITRGYIHKLDAALLAAADQGGWPRRRSDGGRCRCRRRGCRAGDRKAGARCNSNGAARVAPEKPAAHRACRVSFSVREARCGAWRPHSNTALEAAKGKSCRRDRAVFRCGPF